MNRIMIFCFAIVFKMFPLWCNAQSYKLLAADPKNDLLNANGIDVKEVYYAIDMAKDSLWLKILCHNATPSTADGGFFIRLDTNRVPTDGKYWMTTSDPMWYDDALFIFKYPSVPGYGGIMESAQTKNIASVLRPDDYTFIINTKLSVIDADGKMNLVMISADFNTIQDKGIYDVIPNSGYLAIDHPSGIPEHQAAALQIDLYPVPAANVLHVHTPGHIMLSGITIADMAGRIVAQYAGEQREMQLDISKLAPGQYFFWTTAGSRQVRTTFIKR